MIHKSASGYSVIRYARSPDPHRDRPFPGDCRKQFTVRVGTIFEESHLPMTKWLQAIFLMASSKKGVSAHQLHRYVAEFDFRYSNRIATGCDDTMRAERALQGVVGKRSKKSFRSRNQRWRTKRRRRIR